MRSSFPRASFLKNLTANMPWINKRFRMIGCFQHRLVYLLVKKHILLLILKNGQIKKN